MSSSTGNRSLTPPGFAPPSANYALAMLSPGSGPLLHTSGIGPVNPDGTVPEDLDRQVEAVWSTLTGLVGEAGMTMADIVSVTTYVVLPGPGEEELSARLATVMAGRDAALDRHRCASTLVPVPALATSSWKLEIAVVAAGNDRSS